MKLKKAKILPFQKLATTETGETEDEVDFSLSNPVCGTSIDDYGSKTIEKRSRVL